MRGLRAALAAAAGLLLALLALAGGVGWLYALYRGGQLALGPRVPDALPLEALAGHAGQPLLRFAVAWLTAGAAHHTVMTTQVGLEAFRDFAKISGVELLVIDEATTLPAFEQEIRANAAYYRLAQGL